MKKLANLTHEMNRIDMDILRVAETCWLTGKRNTENGKFFYSDNEDRNHRKCVYYDNQEFAELIAYFDHTVLVK